MPKQRASNYMDTTARDTRQEIKDLPNQIFDLSWLLSPPRATALT